MKIPVFHDDQHGTAIIAAAAVLNGLELVGKDIRTVKIACSGAGAAAIACLDQLVSLGVRTENILVTDAKGVVYEGRTEGMDPIKARYARPTSAGTLGSIIEGADISGLSAGGVLEPGHGQAHGEGPADPGAGQPDARRILPEEAKAVRPDAIIATGRSDYPNQVNNVLCFPFLFRGALDVGATTINEAMNRPPFVPSPAWRTRRCRMSSPPPMGIERLQFGPDYLIPHPVRSAPDRTHRARGSQSRHGQRRGEFAAGRPRSLPANHGALHVSVRRQHGTGLRRSQGRPETDCVCRG